MNFKQLNHLIALADEGRFVTAAEKVHLSQAALSRSIQALEQEVGLRLFDRGPQGARLTPAGQAFVERARRLLFDAHCMTHELDLIRQGEQGQLNFGAGPIPSALIVPPLLVALHAQRPGLATCVRSGNHQSLLDLLHAEAIDFFMADPRLFPADARLDMLPLARLHGGLYCRAQHPLAGQAVGLEAMARYGLAAVSMTAPLRQLLAAAFGFDANHSLPMRIECDDLGALCRLAHESEALVLLPDALAPATLVKLPAANSALPLFADLHAIWLRGRTLAPSAALAMQLAREIGAPLSS
ncbi:MAG: LysR family transcriptional regulator [Pseudomonadota bacterium]